MFLQDPDSAEEEIFKLVVAARPDLSLDSMIATPSAEQLGRADRAAKALVIHAAWPEDRAAVLGSLINLYPSRFVSLPYSCSAINAYIQLECMFSPVFLHFIPCLGFSWLRGQWRLQ